MVPGHNLVAHSLCMVLTGNARGRESASLSSASPVTALSFTSRQEWRECHASDCHVVARQPAPPAQLWPASRAVKESADFCGQLGPSLRPVPTAVVGCCRRAQQDEQATHVFLQAHMTSALQAKRSGFQSDTAARPKPRFRTQAPGLGTLVAANLLLMWVCLNGQF